MPYIQDITEEKKEEEDSPACKIASIYQYDMKKNTKQNNAIRTTMLKRQ